MSHRASWNHWECRDDHVGNELRRLVEVRYGLAAEVTRGVVYDAGCGHGYGASLLAASPRISKVIAADIDHVAIDAACSHLLDVPKVHLRVCDVEKHAIPTCQWMVCTEVLEHLNDAESFIAHAKERVTHGMILSWPLGKTSNTHHTRCPVAGDLRALAGDWPGELSPMAQCNPDGEAVRQHELGVFRRPPTKQEK